MYIAGRTLTLFMRLCTCKRYTWIWSRLLSISYFYLINSYALS